MAIKGLEKGKRVALLISECQNGIANPAFSDTPLCQQVVARDTIGNVNQIAAGFRKAGMPVVHCTISARPDYAGWRVNCVLAAGIKKSGRLQMGTPSAAIHDDVVVDQTDILSDRHHGMAAFTGTDLHATLRGFEIDTVVFCGVSTNVALMGGSVEAVGLGYDVVIAEDCAAGGTAETHQIQVTMHLPLVATISNRANILSSPALADA